MSYRETNRQIDRLPEESGRRRKRRRRRRRRGRRRRERRRKRRRRRRRKAMIREKWTLANGISYLLNSS